MRLNEFIQIGSNIKAIRKEKGYSQKYMADEVLKIPRSTYSNYENNNRVPDKATLEKIAEVLDVEISDLFNPDEYERMKFASSFDESGFDSIIIERINNIKDRLQNVWPDAEIDNTVIIQNILLTWLAEEKAENDCGVSSMLTDFLMSENKLITGKQFFDHQYNRKLRQIRSVINSRDESPGGGKK